MPRKGWDPDQSGWTQLFGPWPRAERNQSAVPALGQWRVPKRGRWRQPLPCRVFSLDNTNNLFSGLRSGSILSTRNEPNLFPSQSRVRHDCKGRKSKFLRNIKGSQHHHPHWAAKLNCCNLSWHTCAAGKDPFGSSMLRRGWKSMEVPTGWVHVLRGPRPLSQQWPMAQTVNHGSQPSAPRSSSPNSS